MIAKGNVKYQIILAYFEAQSSWFYEKVYFYPVSYAHYRIFELATVTDKSAIRHINIFFFIAGIFKRMKGPTGA